MAEYPQLDMHIHIYTYMFMYWIGADITYIEHNMSCALTLPLLSIWFLYLFTADTCAQATQNRINICMRRIIRIENRIGEDEQRQAHSITHTHTRKWDETWDEMRWMLFSMACISLFGQRVHVYVCPSNVRQIYLYIFVVGEGEDMKLVKHSRRYTKLPLNAFSNTPPTLTIKRAHCVHVLICLTL